MLAIVSAKPPRPMLDSFTVWIGLTVPTVCGANTRLEAERADSTTGKAVQAPFSEMLCGPAGSFVGHRDGSDAGSEEGRNQHGVHRAARARRQIGRTVIALRGRTAQGDAGDT